ncbi:pseudouridine synthase [Streptomyces polygonati]|uniref:RNA pseudouridylate synthase n=1 Tax=Streptomyces polygonati TaxID=1617087 RepID=A0ABV8HNT3_9ACTN
MARRPGRKAPPSPLEQRDGVDPVCLRLPGDTGGMEDVSGSGGGRPATIRGYLLERYAAAIGPARVEAMLADGRFVGEEGRPVNSATPYEAGAHIWFHRDFAPELPVPFPIGIVYRDERIVIADKPHFLATTPRGRHITQTAVARLRRDLDLPRLSPAHRLDRLTAGLVLFVVRPEDRGAYQTLFRDRRVHKEYEAVAVHDPAVELPRTVRSRIEKEHGVLTAREVSGPVNAETRVELLAQRDRFGSYRLLPATGRTHQLRVHMNALGLPLLNDPLYPEIAPELAEDDPGRFDLPLQLLARALEFTDPWTGRRMRFESSRELAAWRGGAAH